MRGHFVNGAKNKADKIRLINGKVATEKKVYGDR